MFRTLPRVLLLRTLLTEEEAKRIISACKEVRGDVRWHYDANEGFAKAHILVENSLGVSLKICCNANLEIAGMYSFSLILNNRYRIMGLDVEGSHGNKHTDDKQWRKETHKHRWTDRCREAFAFTPDVPMTRFSDVDQAFREFCEECNVAFGGSVAPLPDPQLGLPM